MTGGEQKIILENLPTAERQNLTLISSELKPKGLSLYIVGGALTKPWPRKDIDVAVVFEKDPEGITKSESHFQYCLDSYQALLDIIRGLVDRRHEFTISEVIEPERDYEFGDQDSILRHDGSIVVTPKLGTKIELVHTLVRGANNFERSNKNPFQRI